MKIDLEDSFKTLKFNEQNLVETANTLINAKAEGRNIFSQVRKACDYVLPEGMERKSKKHAIYIFFANILDIGTGSKTLHKKMKELYKEMPEFFDPKHNYEADKDKLEIREKKKKTNGKRPRSFLVAPTIDKIIKDRLGHRHHEQLSLAIYECSRKLVMRDEGDPRNIFKHVKDYKVALSRLDVGKPIPPKTREMKNLTFPRYAGHGEKVAPLLLIKFNKEGFSNIEESQIPPPFDRHEYNLAIGRGIINIDSEMRKEKVTRLGQAAYRHVFTKYNIPVGEFHEAQWILGSEVCGYIDCYDRKTEDGKQRLCPFKTACKKYLDIENYRLRGFIEPSENKI